MTVELCCSPCRAKKRVAQGVWSPQFQQDVLLMPNDELTYISYCQLAANVKEAKTETTRANSNMFTSSILKIIFV